MYWPLKRSLWLTLLCAVVGIAFGQSAGRLRPLGGQPGQNAVYELRFPAQDTLSPAARFELILPPGFDVSGVQLASSRQLDGGFSVVVAQDTVRILRSGLGRAVPPGAAVDLLFAAVKNPKELPSSVQATVRVFPNPAAQPQVLLIAVAIDSTRSGQ
ncbi:MAG: hypothetical protein ACUVWA_10760 [Candidatus Oleimicrobiaceae bacterium]